MYVHHVSCMLSSQSCVRVWIVYDTFYRVLARVWLFLFCVLLIFASERFDGELARSRRQTASQSSVWATGIWAQAGKFMILIWCIPYAVLHQQTGRSRVRTQTVRRRMILKKSVWQSELSYDAEESSMGEDQPECIQQGVYG